MEKLLTIAIPTYNMEEYLSRCLDSLTASGVQDSLEVIVVNDGSKDRSLEIARRYEANHPDIVKVIDKENGHYGTCINAGLREATGKYFRMVDADDFVDTSALIALLDGLKTCDADLVVTMRSDYTTKYNYTTLRTYSFNSIIETGKVYDASSFSIPDHVMVDEFNMHSMTYKTSILKEIGMTLPGGVCYTDFLYCFYPIDRIKSIQFFALPLYVYFLGRDEQSVSKEVIGRQLPHFLTVMNCMIDHLEAHPTDGTPRVNQLYFLKKISAFFVASILLQGHVTEEQYPSVERIFRFLRANKLYNYYIEKKYFKWFRSSPSLVSLNTGINLFKLTHKKFYRRRDIIGVMVNIDTKYTKC